MLAFILATLLAVLPPCPTEDSSNCGWDASTHNTTGTSFIDIGGTAYYIVPQL